MATTTRGGQARESLSPAALATYYAAKLRTATGWTPRVPLDETLRQVLDAAAR